MKLTVRHALFNALLMTKGLTPNSLAAAIHLPGHQGTVWKFSKGEVLHPRGAWLEPAAKFLGVEPAAFLIDAHALTEAARLGIELNRGREPLPRWSTPRPLRQTRIDPGMLVLQIADLMRGRSDAERRLAAPLFQGAAENPDEAPRIADALRALLADSGKASQTSA